MGLKGYFFLFQLHASLLNNIIYLLKNKQKHSGGQSGQNQKIMHFNFYKKIMCQKYSNFNVILFLKNKKVFNMYNNICE